MEELLRFSVLQPVDKSIRKVIALGAQRPPDGKTPATPAQT